jgi:hypothetical protein
MTRQYKIIFALITWALVTFAVGAVQAATITIGNNDNVTRYPYGLDPGNASSQYPDFVAGGTYQQVYNKAAFPGPATITQIAFPSSSQVSSGPGTATYDCTVYLSTTNLGPNALSTNLVANRGADFVQVFSGPVTATLTASDQFDLIINIDPFTFNPNNGNLLLEVVMNTPTQFTGGPVLYFRAGFDADTSRAANPGNVPDGAFTDAFGMRTRFTTLAPTAATTTLSGQITDANGLVVPGVILRLSGAASSSAITNANGEYRFTDVDAGSFYSVTPELANYHFSPASRSFSLLGSTSEAVFTALPDSFPSANPIDTNVFFVRQHYIDFLGREPDQAGLAFWTNRLDQCGGDPVCLRQRRIDVSAAFFKSAEFHQTGSFIYRLYEGGLGREVKYTEFAADRSRVVGGADLDDEKAAFARDFVARPEFVQKYLGSDSGELFADALLQTLRNATGLDLSSERANLITRYKVGATLNDSRSRTLVHLTENAEVAAALFNRAFVQLDYYGYLRRERDMNGFSFWLDVLNNRDPENYRGMVCSFITSEEYQRRFSPVITHSNFECVQ